MDDSGKGVKFAFDGFEGVTGFPVKAGIATESVPLSPGCTPMGKCTDGRPQGLLSCAGTSDGWRGRSRIPTGPRRWTSREIKLLGTMSDRDVAQRPEIRLLGLGLPALATARFGRQHHRLLCPGARPLLPPRHARNYWGLNHRRKLWNRPLASSPCTASAASPLKRPIPKRLYDPSSAEKHPAASPQNPNRLKPS